MTANFLSSDAPRGFAASANADHADRSVVPLVVPPEPATAARDMDGPAEAAQHEARSAEQPLRRCTLLGVTLDALTEEQAVARLVQWARQSERPRWVFPVNTAILMMLRNDALLREACAAADLVIADGQPLVWASRRLADGLALAERVAGCTLMERLIDAAHEHQLRIYLLGARPEVVERLVARVEQEWPQAVVAGYRHGYFSAEETPQVVRTIADARPDLLFIGLPSPQKEWFCWKYLDQLNTRVTLPVGGSFDVLAGDIRRAPRWMQRAGLEWSWRLIMEPRKLWWRYLSTNSAFLWLVAREAWRRRKAARRQSHT